MHERHFLSSAHFLPQSLRITYCYPILEQERKGKGKVLASELAGKETALSLECCFEMTLPEREGWCQCHRPEFPRAVIWAAIRLQECQCFPNTLTHHPLWQHRDCSKQKPLKCDRVLDWTMQRTDPWFSNNPNGCYLLINFNISDLLVSSLLVKTNVGLTDL